MKKIWICVVITLLFLCGCAANVKDGVALLEKEKYEDAKEAFAKDINKEKNLDEAYHGMGIACFELGDYKSAQDNFELAIEHGATENAVLCGFLGACYVETGNYEKALDVYEKALTQNDITPQLEQEIQYNLIAVYEYMGNWDGAKKQLDKYVQAYPDDTRVDKEADFLETR